MPAMPTPQQWTYFVPGDPMAGDVDVVRFYLQDTDPNLRLLGDAELQFLIDQWYDKSDSLIYVAAVAAERIAAKFAGVVNVNADGVNADVSSLADRYVALAVRLRQAHKDYLVGGEIDLSNLMIGLVPDQSIDPLEFGVGMHDNREAGRQDYGSHRHSGYDHHGDGYGWL